MSDTGNKGTPLSGEERRCPTCDREACRWFAAWVKAGRPDGLRFYDPECKPVDWRRRALAAEQRAAREVDYHGKTVKAIALAAGIDPALPPEQFLEAIARLRGRAIA